MPKLEDRRAETLPVSSELSDDLSSLLKALHHEAEAVRLRATRTLWQRWFAQAGAEAEQRLRVGTIYLEQQRFGEAEQQFSALIEQYPDFAEAWNKRATLRYLRKRYEPSLQDCQRVVALNPHHFGAWNGLGLCYFELERYAEAIPSFRRALAIQPFAQSNQVMILECLARLS